MKCLLDKPKYLRVTQQTCTTAEFAVRDQCKVWKIAGFADYSMENFWFNAESIARCQRNREYYSQCFEHDSKITSSPTVSEL